MGRNKNNMNITIKKSKFIDYYFNTGSDQEQEASLLSLGELALDEMKDGKDATISIEGIWDGCNQDIIPARFFEEMTDDNDDEIGEYLTDYDEITLIEG